MKIGISGKSGSGKSSVARYISDKLGFILVDLDIVSKNIRDKYKKEIQELVKKEIIVDDKIDSKKLGEILFEDKELMDKYNLYIYQKQLDVLKEYENDNIVIDSMFLPIMDIFNELDFKIYVKCDDIIRMERVIKRDSVSKEYFLARDKNSLNYNEGDFDFIINNENGFSGQVETILEKIKKWFDITFFIWNIVLDVLIGLFVLIQVY